MGDVPYAGLNDEELSQARREAASALERQRAGVEESSEVHLDKEVSDHSGILLGPRSTDKITVGPAWGIEGSDSSSSRGLTQYADGWCYTCEYVECDWRTKVLPDGQYGALVEMYKLHVDQCHEKKKTSVDQEKYDKEQESYKEATKLRTVEAHHDNRMDVLSAARFWPMPLSYKHIAKLQPPNQVPVWDRINLSHVGVHLADTSIIKKLHNRAYGGAQLKHFSPSNLGIVETDKDVVLKPSNNGMRQTSHFKVLSNMQEAVGALMNCEVIWRHLHPCDYGTYALVRFLLDRIHHPHAERRLTSVLAVSAFFQAAFKGNADRVLSPEGPRTYQELVTFYNSMDWSSQSSGLDSTGSKRGHMERTPVKSGKKPKRDVEVCYAFNSASGCPRSSGESCKGRKGQEFKHCCNQVDAAGFLCGAVDHGRHNHV